MVEVSRDGRRVYVTNSLYTAVDDQIYPEGIDGWMMKLDADPNMGEMHVDYDGYFGIVDVGDGKMNVAVVIPQSRAKRSRTGWQISGTPDASAKP